MFLHNFISHISDFLSTYSKPTIYTVYCIERVKKRLRDVENKCFGSYDTICSTSETKTQNFPVSFYNVSTCVRGWAKCPEPTGILIGKKNTNSWTK